MKGLLPLLSGFRRLRERAWREIRAPRRAFALGGLVGSGGTCGCCGAAGPTCPTCAACGGVAVQPDGGTYTACFGDTIAATTQPTFGTVTDSNGTYKLCLNTDLLSTLYTDYLGPCPGTGNVGPSKSGVQIYSGDTSICAHSSGTQQYAYVFSCNLDGTVKLRLSACIYLCNDGKQYWCTGSSGGYPLGVSANATPSCSGSTLSATFTFSNLSGGQAPPGGTSVSVAINLANDGYLCCQTFQVNGCNGSPLQGATVQVGGYTRPNGLTGTVTGTTNASGQVTLAWFGPCTANYTVSCSRFNTVGPTSVTFTSGATTTVNLTAASGFACASCSTIPLSTTLHLTDSVYGSTTITYSAGNWVSSTTAWSFGGDGCCGAASFGMIYTFTGSTCQLSSTYGHGAPVVGQAECPNGTGRQTAIPIGSTSLSGNPTSCGNTGWHFSATLPSSTCGDQTVYVYPSGATYTLTE